MVVSNRKEVDKVSEKEEVAEPGIYIHYNRGGFPKMDFIPHDGKHEHEINVDNSGTLCIRWWNGRLIRVYAHGLWIIALIVSRPE